MFGRNTRTRLPQIDTKTDRSANDQHVEQRDKDQRQRMKEYADKRRQSKRTTMKTGDSVLVRQVKFLVSALICLCLILICIDFLLLVPYLK